MEEQLTLFDQTMRKYHRHALMLAFTKATTPEEYFGFHHHDVKAIHLHKNGCGRGFWFRLRDGRVFDKFARPDEPDRIWYDGYINC
jgi:hypothetical protein